MFAVYLPLRFSRRVRLRRHARRIASDEKFSRLAANVWVSTRTGGRRTAKFASIRSGFEGRVAINRFRSKAMGKYFLAWILGVPAAVLVVIYLLMH